MYRNGRVRHVQIHCVKYEGGCGRRGSLTLMSERKAYSSGLPVAGPETSIGSLVGASSAMSSSSAGSMVSVGSSPSPSRPDGMLAPAAESGSMNSWRAEYQKPRVRHRTPSRRKACHSARRGRPVPARCTFCSRARREGLESAWPRPGARTRSSPGPTRCCSQRGRGPRSCASAPSSRHLHQVRGCKNARTRARVRE